MDWQYENGRIFSVNENKELMAETTFVYKEVSNRAVEFAEMSEEPGLEALYEDILA